MNCITIDCKIKLYQDYLNLAVINITYVFSLFLGVCKPLFAFKGNTPYDIYIKFMYKQLEFQNLQGNKYLRTFVAMLWPSYELTSGINMQIPNCSIVCDNVVLTRSEAIKSDNVACLFSLFSFF